MEARVCKPLSSGGSRLIRRHGVPGRGGNSRLPGCEEAIAGDYRWLVGKISPEELSRLLALTIWSVEHSPYKTGIPGLDPSRTPHRSESLNHYRPQNTHTIRTTTAMTTATSDMILKPSRQPDATVTQELPPQDSQRRASSLATLPHTLHRFGIAQKILLERASPVQSPTKWSYSTSSMESPLSPIRSSNRMVPSH